MAFNLGAALGMQSADDYTKSVEAHDRLRKLQDENQYLKEESERAVDVGGQVAGLNKGTGAIYGDLNQPGQIYVPPLPDASATPEGKAESTTPKADQKPTVKTTPEGEPIIQYKDGSLTQPEVIGGKVLEDPYAVEGNNLFPESAGEIQPLPKFIRNGDNSQRTAEIVRRKNIDNVIEQLGQSFRSGKGSRAQGWKDPSVSAE